jgi:SAM-dependent methyltransferase
MRRPSIPAGRSSWLHVPLLFFNRWRTEFGLKRQGLRFRDEDSAVSDHAYASMTSDEFARINACQAWADWRVIPPLIEKVDAPRPWRIIDLGCGQGISTEVLAWCCPAGSSLLGYDLSESALDVAKKRAYRHWDGSPANVYFKVQEVDQPWRDSDENIIENSSVTVVNASGFFGHHLAEERLMKIADEIHRVLAPGGWALLDSGPQLGRRKLERMMSARGFTLQLHRRSWWLDRWGQSAFFKLPNTKMPNTPTG